MNTPEAGRLSVNYLVHDLGDAAVVRRVGMLRDGGASVTLAGFRRERDAVEPAPGVETIDFGRTANGAFAARAAIIVWKMLTIPFWAGRLGRCDIFIARSLELLTLAWAVRIATGSRAPLVYECLDIHRLMFSQGAAGRILRGWERFLLRRCATVITSSPAFVTEYFEKIQGSEVPVLLLENKATLSAAALEAPRTAESSPPWRIGWFGMIRCAKSLELLCELTQALPGQVEVIIAGKVSEIEFDDFGGAVEAASGVRFLGAYAPADLPRLYGDVHFAWAIDFFEEGLNSAWLLPNRLYEGSACGAVPLALEGVETGRWLARQGAGVLFPADLSQALERYFRSLTPAAYAAEKDKVRFLRRELLVTDPSDCDALVEALRDLKEQERAQ